MNVIVLCFWIISVFLPSGTHALENCEIIVDITNGTTDGTNIISNNATYTTNDYFTNSSGVFGCLCNVLNCVQDCCDSGQVLDFSGSALKCTSATSQRYTNLKGAIVHNIIHVPDKFVCSEEEQTVSLEASEYQLELLNHGFLQWDSDTYHYRKYCLSTQESEVVVLVCVVADATVSAIIFCIGMIISMPFLLITFLVYALLPDRNLHQRALMFYVLSLLIAYILLVTINLAPNIPIWFWCKFLGYSTLFFFMVSFFWMNVICFDIWYTFSGGRGFMGSKRTTERRRLIFYSLYANGVPLLIVGWTYGMQMTLPNCEHNPGIGVSKCFLATGWASLWYFYLEAGIVVIANITFFVLTALRIRKVKKETSMLKHNDSKRHTYEKDKQKFNLYVKLLFAMGVNWSMEVISWLVNWNTKSEYQYICKNQSLLSTAVIGTALAAYAYKIGYPLVESLIFKPNRESDSLNNNLVKPNGVKSAANGEVKKSAKKKPNGVVQAHGDPKTNSAISKRNRLITGIPNFNLAFILQFIKLVRIMIPNILCTETALLSGHTIFLFLRTFLSIYVANLEGAIVKFIVRKDPNNFVKQLMKWFAVAVPATFINSMIRYLESRIALRFRTRLVEHSYKLYFKNQSYYRVTVLDGRLDNCAQRLTDDIETVASTVSHLYGQITKPCFDILLMAIALANLVKSRNSNLLIGPVIISGVVVVSALVLRLVSPRFGQLVAQEAEKKGYLRHVHGRIVSNAEEIAFYNGHKVEQSHLRSAFRILTQHLEHMFAVKLWFVMLEQFLMKYVWSGTGMIVVSLPVFLPQVIRQVRTKKRVSFTSPKQITASKAEPSSLQDSEISEPEDSVSERTHYFTTAKNLLLTGSNAVERLMSSYKDIVELAGHTARVANMFSVLEEASNGIYHKTVVAKKETTGGFEVEFKGDQPVAKGKVFASTHNEIILKNVPIVTPNCDVVCPSLSVNLKPGQHLLITGPNGCGKSSLFRILSGLWPVYGGELTTPRHSMFYIPQRPYMVIGNLRDQIIYPDTYADMINKQITETDLRKIMQMVHLEHIVERDTFHEIKDWTDILSGGEKQRMAVARLFYHKPKYALLDECTSAVSIDVESNIYQTAIDMGITLLTITHRPTLWKFHTHILQFDGQGYWEFSELNCTSRMDLKKEKDELILKPNSDEKTQRLKEINKELGEDDD